MYEHVQANPGRHLREIGRKCDVPLSTALYHLDRLGSKGLITIRRDGHHERYFPANGWGRREKDLLSAFRHSVPRRIGAALLDVPTLTQRELCALFGVSRNTLSFHVNSLNEKEILRRGPARPESKYLLVDAVLSREIITKYSADLGELAPLRAPPAPPSTRVEA